MNRASRLLSSMLLALSAVATDAGALPERPVAEACETPRVARTGRIYAVAAIGDSLTDVRVGGGRYLDVLRKRCPQSRFDAYGVGGQRTDHMRWRAARDLFGPDPLSRSKPAYTHAIVLGGVNDLAAALPSSARSLATQRNLSHIYRTARERGVEVVAVTLPPSGTLRGSYDRRAEAARSLNSWIVAQQRSGTVSAVVDISPLLSCGEGVLCPRFRKTPDDRVHWNGAGHERVGDALHRVAFSDCR